MSVSAGGDSSSEGSKLGCLVWLSSGMALPAHARRRGVSLESRRDGDHRGSQERGGIVVRASALRDGTC